MGNDLAGWVKSSLSQQPLPKPLHKSLITPSPYTPFLAVEEKLTHGAEGDKPALRALHLWCVKQYVLALLLAGRKDQAQQFLQQVTTD